jgi:hypothetical protein
MEPTQDVNPSTRIVFPGELLIYKAVIFLTCVNLLTAQVASRPVVWVEYRNRAFLRIGFCHRR